MSSRVFGPIVCVCGSRSSMDLYVLLSPSNDSVDTLPLHDMKRMQGFRRPKQLNVNRNKRAPSLIAPRKIPMKCRVNRVSDSCLYAQRCGRRGSRHASSEKRLKHWVFKVETVFVISTTMERHIFYGFISFFHIHRPEPFRLHPMMSHR